MAMSDLALTYSIQKRFAKAQTLQLEALESKRQVLGSDHPSTLDSLHYLVIHYQGCRKYDEAEKVLSKALKARIRTQGKSNRATQGMMHTPASTYSKLGRLDEAEKLYVEALRFGRDPFHQTGQFLMIQQDLMALYLKREKTNEAETLFNEMVDVNKHTASVGEHIFDMHETKHDFAHNLTKQGRLDEAEQLYMKVIEEETRSLGLKHEHTIRSPTDLSIVYLEQSRSEEAEKFLVGIAERSRNALGDEHSETERAKSILNKVYQKGGRTKSAE